MKKITTICFGILVLLNFDSYCFNDDSDWTFVSIPDFLNVDCDYPQPGWEDALSYILNEVSCENSEFVLVPGDLVMGHWDAPKWSSKDTIEKYSNRYYEAWKNRMGAHDLKYYTSIGDHEIGDDPWESPEKIQAIKFYKQAFGKHLDMPSNGPDHMKKTAFWWRHKNVLFISVDVFEKGESEHGKIKPGVTGDQLEWMTCVLEENSGADHIIVMGHVPVLGPVRKWSSSGLKIEEGANSGFWQLMKAFNVDAYLCGEVHAITCTEQDDIFQIAHGGLVGYNSRTNYMKVTVSKQKLIFEIKEIEMKPEGGYLWQTKNNRPLERVIIDKETRHKGFESVGYIEIDKSTGRSFINRKGYFLEKYARSDDEAVPVFKRFNLRFLPNSLEKVTIDD